MGRHSQKHCLLSHGNCHLYLLLPNLSLFVCYHSCIVTCNTQGHIYFYDGDFLFLACYTELNLDAILSISFSKEWNKREQEYDLDSKPLITRYKDELLQHSAQRRTRPVKSDFYWPTKRSQCLLTSKIYK